MKYLLRHFSDQAKSVLIESCSTKVKTPHLRPLVSDVLKKFHSLLYFRHSIYVGRILTIFLIPY